MKIKVIDLIFSLKSSCLAKEEEIREKLSLSPAEFRGILSVNPLSKVQCNVLCKNMGLSISRGSRVIHKMIKNGYLKDMHNKKDKRIMEVYLTEKGINARKNIQKILDECEKTILKKISEKEMDIFKNSLSKISKILVNK